MDYSRLKFDRLRPLRSDQATRDANAEVNLNAGHFILPFFVVEGPGRREPIATLHGVSRLSIDQLVIDCAAALAAGIDKVLLFGVLDKAQKGPTAPAAVHPDSLIARAVRALKAAHPQLTVMTDICVCAYMDHGHCGVLHGHDIDNDATLPLLAEMALAHARAGADVVAPSAMMDGQVAAIRGLLDEHGLTQTKVMGYSAKYASRLYGPFRDAADSAPAFGDRRSYQQDPRCGDQGLREAIADHAEGAALLMVKPSTFYLDVLRRIKDRFPHTPLAAYHTSGEYMMLKHGAAHGLFDYPAMLLEALYGLRRAGTDLIITYAAVEAAALLKESQT